MSHFKLKSNGLQYSVPQYGGLGNLQRIIARNRENYRKYFQLGNRVVPSQHPLVQLLQHFSVDIVSGSESLFNLVELKSRQYASLVNLTSLYNKGKDHLDTVFPESNHHTLFVVPFDNEYGLTIDDLSREKISEQPILSTIFSTSNIQYWDLSKLLDSEIRKSQEDFYTAIQVDVHRLVLSYYYYLTDRVSNDINVGLTPQHFIYLVLMDYYPVHNETVMLNYTAGDRIVIQDPPFAFTDYAMDLDKYVTWKKKKLMSDRLRSFTEYMEYHPTLYPNSGPFINCGKSQMFIQLGWIYTLAALYWVKPYLSYMDYMGYQDPIIESQLRTFYKLNPAFILNQIKDPYWRNKFHNVHLDLKER